MKFLYSLFKKLPPSMQWLTYHLTNTHFLVGVVGIIEQDGKVLLTQSTYRHGWALPGGMLQKGEDISACLSRELQEELNLSVEEISFLCSTTLAPRLLEVCLTAKAIDQRIKSDNKEVKQFAYFGPGELPPTISPSSRRCIERYFSLK